MMPGSMLPSWNITETFLLLPVKDEDDSSYMRIELPSIRSILDKCLYALKGPAHIKN